MLLPPEGTQRIEHYTTTRRERENNPFQRALLPESRGIMKGIILPDEGYIKDISSSN